MAMVFASNLSCCRPWRPRERTTRISAKSSSAASFRSAVASVFCSASVFVKPPYQRVRRVRGGIIRNRVAANHLELLNRYTAPTITGTALRRKAFMWMVRDCETDAQSAVTREVSCPTSCSSCQPRSLRITLLYTASRKRVSMRASTVPMHQARRPIRTDAVIFSVRMEPIQNLIVLRPAPSRTVGNAATAFPKIMGVSELTPAEVKRKKRPLKKSNLSSMSIDHKRPSWTSPILSSTDASERLTLFKIGSGGLPLATTSTIGDSAPEVRLPTTLFLHQGPFWLGQRGVQLRLLPLAPTSDALAKTGPPPPPDTTVLAATATRSRQQTSRATSPRANFWHVPNGRRRLRHAPRVADRNVAVRKRDDTRSAGPGRSRKTTVNATTKMQQIMQAIALRVACT
mmetsp:Transcript_22079/g.58409  ORF Transcript_22079/g.58409 Transcript_22079/m.58409 type:complete len:400 (-) Transcript_22079:92-1291(-)